MKKQIYIITLFLFFVLPYSVFSQNFQTSTELSAERMALLEEASRAIIDNQYQSDNNYVIPLTIHILHETDGSGGASNDDVLETFCDAMTYYAEYGITLYIDTIQHTNNSNFYNDFNNNLNAMTFLLNKENTINIYMLKGISFGPCNLYSPNTDAIVFLGNTCFSGAFIAGMLGRYFGLAPTYFGFEGSVNNNCGVQVTSGEKVDGSNCDTAGDRICDTPPDYATYLWECDANGEGCIQIDPDGVEFRPDGTNFMSASRCGSRFSPMQEQAMKYMIDNSLQDLSVLPVPSNLSEITAAPTLLSPENEADNIFHEAVHFTWEPVENATHYLIEINRIASFNPTFEVASIIVDTNEYTNDELPPASYYWRIKPYNPGYLCASYSDSGSFTTTLETNIQAVDGLQDFQIYPNPATVGTSIGVELQSDKYLEGILSLHNVHGQVVYSNAITTNGTNRYEIKTEDLPSGLYVVNVDFKGGAMIQKKVLIIGE